MRKVFVIWIFSLSMIIPSFAKGSKFWNGPYFGLFTGIELGKVKNSVTGNLTNGNATLNSNNDIATNGLNGGTFLGYNSIYKKYLFGIEIGGGLCSSNGNRTYNLLSNAVVSESMSVKKTSSMYLVFRLGRAINGYTNLYLKGGYALSSYNFKLSIDNDFMADQMNTKVNSNKRLLQPIAGLGIEHIIGKTLGNLFLRLGVEYEHGFGKKINIPLQNNSFSGQTKFKPSYNILKFRMIFRM